MRKWLAIGEQRFLLRWNGGGAFRLGAEECGAQPEGEGAGQRLEFCRLGFGRSQPGGPHLNFSSPSTATDRSDDARMGWARRDTSFGASAQTFIRECCLPDRLQTAAGPPYDALRRNISGRSKEAARDEQGYG